MTREGIIERLRDQMKKSGTAQGVDWDAVTLKTRIDSIVQDSLAILDLIYDVQQAFGLDFEPEKLTEAQTVGDLVDFLERELAA